MKVYKKYFLSIIFLFLLFLWDVCFSWDFGSLINPNNEHTYCQGDECGLDKWIEKITEINTLETRGASEYIQDVVGYILTFVALIAIIIIIYAWFNLLTSIWDEDKAKKSKQIIMYAILWIALIYIAGPLIRFVINALVS